MIITKSPIRISLLGGGTDYPTYLAGKNYGMVVGSAIDKYSYIALRELPPFFDYKTKLVYSQVEYVKENEEIAHRVIKETLKYFGIEDGLEISHLCDIPSKSGLGSSSTFLSCLVCALEKYKKKSFSKENLAKTVIHIEQNVMKENVGYQDTIWAVYGGTNYIKFYPDQSYTVHPIVLKQEDREYLENHLCLIFTGISRFSTDIAKTYVNKLSREKHQGQMNILQMAYEGLEAIFARKYDKIGELLHKSWEIKRSLSDSVSSPEIDGLYQTAMENGALGGKIVGAGGGGCMIFYVDPDKKEKMLNALKKNSFIVNIPFKFDDEGTKIIY